MWLLTVSGAVAAAVLVVALGIRRSRAALVELVKLVPACLALMRDILRDPEIPRRAKLAPALTFAYLALPLDLIPDFIPGVGQLEDALVVAWAMRRLIRRAGRERVEGLWRGDPATLQRILRLARVP